MKFNKTVENGNYEFRIDFENEMEIVLIGHDTYYLLSDAQNIIDTLYMSPYKKHLTNENLLLIDSQYQNFLKEVNALHGEKYRKCKVNFNGRTFTEMKTDLKNGIENYKKQNNFSNKKMDKLLKGYH